MSARFLVSGILRSTGCSLQPPSISQSAPSDPAKRHPPRLPFQRAGSNYCNFHLSAFEPCVARHGRSRISIGRTAYTARAGTLLRRYDLSSQLSRNTSHFNTYSCASMHVPCRVLRVWISSYKVQRMATRNAPRSLREVLL